VHVLDASRGGRRVHRTGPTPVWSGAQAADFAAKVATEYEAIRVERAGNTKEKVAPLQAARDNQFKIDWSSYTRRPSRPSAARASLPSIPCTSWSSASTGRRSCTRLGAGRQLSGHSRGTRWWARARRKLYADARKMLDHIVREKWLTAKGVVSFWPCRRAGDDVVLFADEARTKESSRASTSCASRSKSAHRAPICASPTSSRPWPTGSAASR